MSLKYILYGASPMPEGVLRIRVRLLEPVDGLGDPDTVAARVIEVIDKRRGV